MSEDLINKNNKRNTKQKCLVLDCFVKNGSRHLTAEDVFNILKEHNAFVSRATIYRCIKNLLKDGVIKEYKLNKKSSACFQYINEDFGCSMHCHLICKKCEKIIHFESEEILKFQNNLNEENGFLVDIPSTSFYGICNSCKKLSY